MQKTLTIRAATSDDQSTVVELWRACGLVTSYNDPAADFAFAKSGACSDILVGEFDGVILASVMVGHDGHRGWIYYVSADPTARRVGFGRQIVEAAENWLRDRGVVKMQLMVRETNTDVVSFYEQLGFELTPRIVLSKWLGKSN